MLIDLLRMPHAIQMSQLRQRRDATVIVRLIICRLVLFSKVCNVSVWLVLYYMRWNDIKIDVTLSKPCASRHDSVTVLSLPIWTGKLLLSLNQPINLGIYRRGIQKCPIKTCFPLFRTNAFVDIYKSVNTIIDNALFARTLGYALADIFVW